MKHFVQITCLFFCLFLCNVYGDSPVIALDFEEIQGFGLGKGLNQTAALDMTMGSGSKPVLIQDADILEKLSGIHSLTITGWMKRKVSFDDVGKPLPVLLHCPGHFRIEFGRWGRIGLVMEGDDQRRKQIWSDWIGIQDISPDQRWVYFAFTYDGTKEGPNAAFYHGYPKYDVRQVVYAPADSGQAQQNPDQMWTGDQQGFAAAGLLARTPVSGLVIGAYDKNGARAFNGQLDNLRIYVSGKDGSAALSQVQIEEIRREDLGRKRIEQVALQKEQTKRKKQNQIWEIERKYWHDSLNLHPVDLLGRVFSDRPPQPLLDACPQSIPSGAKACFLFAAMSREKEKISARIEVSPLESTTGQRLDAKAKTYHVLHVPIEANTNGGIRTTISSRPPEIWMEHLIREAPFQIAEVLVETNTFDLRENSMHEVMYKAVLVEVDIPSGTKPGLYNSKLTLHTPDQKITAPFSFRVHEFVMPPDPALNNVYWFKADPVNLTTGPQPSLWSDDHWQLIENSARTLHEYGQNSISVALMNYRDETIPFIQTIRKPDGSYDFDFTMFDKWIETFKRAGFTQFEGECTFGGHKVSALNVKALDSKTNRMVTLFTTDSPLDEWFDFMAVFYTHLYRHIKEKGWEENYVQAVCDEPTDMKNYIKAYELTKEYMPDIPTKEACGTRDYSPYIDIQVFNMALFRESYQQLAVERRQQGKGVWFYHCASPYPPYPNRHLDDPLTCSRLYPWLCWVLNADGYLFWAANNYRQADPYKSSIGPLPGGITNPGHPPGDDWMYYPGPTGLRGSMRMLAFREGLVDYTLLEQLARIDKPQAQRLAGEIIRTPVDYQKDPESYRNARKELLELLDRYMD